MQARVRQVVSAPGAASGMLVPPGRSLETSASAVGSVEMGRSSWSHHSSYMEMVGSVFPATMSWEKATMRPSSAVLFASEKGIFSIPHRTLMWRVGSSTMMSRDVL